MKTWRKESKDCKSYDIKEKKLMVAVLEKEIQREKMYFTNGRALFWPREQILIISDLHVGKPAHFRKNGIPIPTDVLHKDLKNLEQLLDYFEVKHLLIVGDLFHAGQNTELDIFCTWRKGWRQLAITLVRGNHDRISSGFCENNGIKVVENKMEISPFTFVHGPTVRGNKFTISGHIHPGIVVGNKKERVKLHCFLYSDVQLILPAFSEFTGLDTSMGSSSFKAVAFTETLIFEV